MSVIAEQAVMSPLKEFGLLVGPEVGLHLEKMSQCGLLQRTLCLAESRKGGGNCGRLARGGLHGGGEFLPGRFDVGTMLLSLLFVGLLERVQNHILLGRDIQVLMHPEMQCQLRLTGMRGREPVEPPGSGG